MIYLSPFSVIATQNPSDLSGTSLLPESQLDRFSVSFSLDQLNQNERIKILNNEINKKIIKDKKFNYKKIKSLNTININELVLIYLDNINQYIKKKFDNTHISIRCLKQTISISKALALINQQEYVTFQEIKDTLPYVLRHRINLVEKNETVDFIKSEILDKVPLPDEV